MPFDGPHHDPHRHPWNDDDPEDMKGRRNACGGIGEGLALSFLIVWIVVAISYGFRYFWSLFHVGVH